MKVILNWIKSWFRISKKMSYLDKKIEKLRKSSDKANAIYNIHMNNLDKIEQKFADEFEKVQISLNNANAVNKKLEEALDSANEELKTANDILIPGLIAANKVFVDRWDAESAVLAMRLVAIEPSKDIEL